MKILFILGLILFQSDVMLSQNPFWVRKDKKNIKKICEKYQDAPEKIPQFFGVKEKSKSNKFEDLGFGYQSIEKGIGGGYVSIYADFYFLKDSLIGYSVFPELPDEEDESILREKYLTWYSACFLKNNNLEPLFHNINAINSPLKQYPGKVKFNDLSKDVQYYYSLNSGTRYGLRGGVSNALLRNRQIFTKIKNKITFDELEFLMYSKNPATRLTAIEYYLRNKENISKRIQDEKWIDEMLENTPIVQTLRGCMVSYTSPRELLYQIVNSELNPYE